MKKIRYSILILIALVIISCKKEVEPPDYNSRILITTEEATNIEYQSATVKGSINNEYGYQITEYGHCWDTETNPDISKARISFSTISSSKTFTSELQNLTSDEEYYVKAYFRIGETVVYSDEITFSTVSLGPPVVQTASVTNITANSATSGGNITDDGGSSILARGICWNTSGSPTLNDDYTTDGTGTGSYTSNLNGLQAETDYYVRAYATSEYGTEYGNELQFTTALEDLLDSRDGNTYKVVKIGDQVWMAENLAYLPSVSPSTEASDTYPIYYVYDYEWTNINEAKATSNYQTYGVLYNWPAAMEACPTGWHLPSDYEWQQLMDFVEDDGYVNMVGLVLKATNGWAEDGNGTDIYDFSALPGGLRWFEYDGGPIFRFKEVGAYWWSSTETEYDNDAWSRYLRSENSDFIRERGPFDFGFSVRCIRDE